MASGNINASQGGCGNYDDIIVGTGPDPQLGKVAAYIVSEPALPCNQPRWTKTVEEKALPVNHYYGSYVTAGQFGQFLPTDDDPIVAGQVGVAGYVTNAVQGLSCCDWSIPTSPKLQRIDSFYFDSYNMFIGSTVAATHVPFAPAPLGAMQGGAPSLPSASSSEAPFMIVGRDMPVRRAILEIPPRPRASARSATRRRACASFIVLKSLSQRACSPGEPYGANVRHRPLRVAHRGGSSPHPARTCGDSIRVILSERAAQAPRADR